MKEKKIPFHSSHDEGIKASYIYLKNSLHQITPGESVKQIILDNTMPGVQDFKGELVIDIDKDGKIVGIEILGDVIPDELIK